MKKLLVTTLLIFGTLFLASCGKDKDKNKISLSYADWGDQVVNQKMIDAFMEKYPNISVELRGDISGSGEEFTGNLITASEQGILPDVFATDNVPVVVDKGLTLDVSEYWDEDEDAAKVYDFMAQTAVYGTKRYAIPSFQFLKGIMINLDIFDSANLTTVEGKYRMDDNGYPVKDWTFQEMIEIAKAIKSDDLTNPNAIAGLDTWYGTPDFQQVWPMMDDPDLMYDTWNGEKFNYENQYWIDAMKAKVELHQLTDGTTTRFTEEQLAQNENLNGYLIQTGHAAMDIEGSWQFWVIQQAHDEGMNLGFWPYPQSAVSDKFFPPVVLDYQIVSSQTEHPEEAFLLAKWMTFGYDGWKARIDILKEQRTEEIAAGEAVTYLDRYPVADYADIWTDVRTLISDAEGKEIEGLAYTFDNIANGKPDLDKWIPGYRDFWSWVAAEDNNYSWDKLVTAGTTAVASYAKEWNTKINELFKDAYEKLSQ
ncbi:MAG: ABC transporter substrate-binding protein [Acholeplasma sp.]|nr:ABC transporter substrate-binding protein [Acholeplasma sp.]